MIIVLGGTGNIGAPLVAELKERGADFRVVSRNPDSAAATLGDGIAIAQGDLGSPDTLAGAFQGGDILFLHSGASPALADEQKAAISAAKDAGIGYIVKISGNERGMRPDAPAMILRSHHEVEQALGESGIDHTFVRPNFFFQNFLNMAPMVAQQGKLMAPVPGDVEIAMLDAKDIATVAARCLTESGHAGQAYALHGEAKTYTDVAAALSDVLGREIPHVQVPKEAALGAAKERGMPDWMVDHMEKMIDAQAAGMLSGDPAVLHDLLGRPQTTLKEFVEANKAAFAG